MSKKKAQKFYSAIDEIADKEAFLESVREKFSEVEDPRAKDNQRYVDFFSDFRQIQKELVQARCEVDQFPFFI